jgi:PAS domain S-box-containing protein
VARPDWTNKELRRLQALNQLLVELTRAKAPEEVHEAAIASLLAATTADRAAILTFDFAGIMRFDAWRGLSEAYRAAVTGHTPWPRGTRGAKTITIHDALADPSLGGFHDLFRKERIRSLGFVPLELDDGVLGKFMLYRAEPHQWTREELEIAEGIAGHVALATDHQRTEATRRELERAARLMAAIVENSEDAILSKDLNGIIMSWNKGAERIFGYTPEEAIGQPVSMLAVSDRRNEMPQILNRIRRGERIRNYETIRRRKDGQAIHVSLSVSPVLSSTGEIIGAAKFARDISERKRAEAERAELLTREREARETAELLNRVGPMLAAQLEFDKLAQVVIEIARMLVGAEFGAFLRNVTDENGPSLSWHTLSGASWESLSGLTSPDNRGKLVSLFGSEGRIRCDDVTADPRFGAVAVPRGGENGDFVMRSCLAASVVARSGEMLGGLLFGHSQPEKFTALHEAILTGVAAQTAIAMDNAFLFEQGQWVQAELKRSNEDLRRANQDLETFAYSASHDLQEPLRTIAICAQLLERTTSAQLNDEARTFLQNIFDGATRMTTLIQDLLAYTTAAKHAEGPPPEVDSAIVVGEVLENLKATIGLSGGIVTATNLPVVRIHPSRLAQLVQNLIGNALKYRGPAPPRVSLSAEERDGWTVFCVTDNGIGIEPQYANQIFGLFKRLHSRQAYSGSGIGLAMCQRIVEQYGGRIWLERSAPGEGSTFCFALPSRR